MQTLTVEIEPQKNGKFCVVARFNGKEWSSEPLKRKAADAKAKEMQEGLGRKFGLEFKKAHEAETT